MPSSPPCSPPQDWTPEGGSESLNKKFNTHGSLGKRAKKLDKGILTIRFEMPFNVSCKGCNHTIARGVRFNAEKKRVGQYYSTPIYSFRMTSTCCATAIEVHTDPKAAEYVVVEGAERCVGGAGAGTRYGDENPLDLEGTTEVELLSREERDELAADPFAQLERQREMGTPVDALTTAAARRTGHGPALAHLGDLSDARWRDDYNVNKSLRRALRGQRKEAAATREEARELGLPEHVKLLPGTEEDAAAARAAFRSRAVTGQNIFDRNRAEKRRTIRSSSIFSGPGVGSGAGGSGGGGVTGSRGRIKTGGGAGSVGVLRTFGGIFGGGDGGGGYRSTSAAVAAKGLAARRSAASAASTQSRAMKLVKRRVEGSGSVLKRS